MFYPHTSNLSVVLVLALAGVATIACGAATPASSPATAQEETSDDGVMKFDDMSAPQKMQHMKKVVAPGMAKVFQEDDAEEYAKFDCASCHGAGAKAGNFAMPTTELPALNMAEIDWEAPVVKFMSERVVPEMAKMLGEEPDTEQTGEGFGCMDCHTSKE